MLVRDHNWDRLVRSGLQRIDCQAQVSLYTTSEAVSPFVWGFFKYKIVVQKNFLTSASTKTLENIFAHELIHVRDHDSLWRLLELVCRRILFFHPFMLFVSARYLINLEKAADEEAVQAGGVSAPDLLKSLLEVIGFSRKLQSNPMLLSASRSFQELKERMESLSKMNELKPSAFNFRYVLSVSLFMALGFSIAQAKISVGGFADSQMERAGMCTQAKQEQIIESWLKIKPTPNKCDTN